MDFFDFLGRAVCHQVAERSFWVGGKPLMVCARCQGLYLSFFLSFLFLWKNKKILSSSRDFSLAIVLILPLAFDGFFSYLGLWTSNNNLRFLSGILAGFSFALLLLPLVKENSAFQKPFSSYLFERAKGLSLSFFLAIVLRVLSRYYSGGYLVENLLTASGLILLFFLLNLAWLDWLLPIRRARKLLLILAAFSFSLLEIFLLSFFHFRWFF